MVNKKSQTKERKDFEIKIYNETFRNLIKDGYFLQLEKSSENDCLFLGGEGGMKDKWNYYIITSFWEIIGKNPKKYPGIRFTSHRNDSTKKFNIIFTKDYHSIAEEFKLKIKKEPKYIECYNKGKNKNPKNRIRFELLDISKIKNYINIIDNIIKEGNHNLTRITKEQFNTKYAENIKFIESLSPENNNKEKVETEEEKMEKIKNKTYDVNEDGNLNGISYPEGTEKIAKHKIFERNPKLISDAKKYFKYNNNGQLFCEVCGFNFKETYSLNSDENRLEEYIEAHHKFPLSEIKNTTKSTISDLAMLCANCHRMIHFSGGKGCIDYDDFKKKFGKEK